MDTADLEKWVDGRLARFERPRHVYVSEDPIPRASKDAKVARGEIKVLVRGLGCRCVHPSDQRGEGGTS